MMRIAIIRRNGLGDLLCVLPLVALCRQKFQEAEITLFIDQRAAPLVPYLRGVDRVVHVAEAKNKYIAMARTLWAERKYGYDLAISAKSSPMKLMNFFLYGLQAKQTIAYVDRSWHAQLVSHPLIFDSCLKRHQALRCIQLIEPNCTEINPSWYPSIEAEAMQLALPRPIVFLSVTNNRIGSMLDFEKYASVLNGLYQERMFSVVVNAEACDQIRAAKLQQLLQMPTQVIVTSIFSDFVNLVAAVDVLLIGDGGIMHIAAALNKPQVILFGGTAVWEWAPMSSQAICLSDADNVNCIPLEQISSALRGYL